MPRPFGRGTRNYQTNRSDARFHTAAHELTESQIRYLTEIDHDTHEALVAEAETKTGERGVAVARYVRLDEEPEVAEVAITVADEYQDQGVGSAILDELSHWPTAEVSAGSGAGCFPPTGGQSTSSLREEPPAGTERGSSSSNCPSHFRSRSARIGGFHPKPGCIGGFASSPRESTPRNRRPPVSPIGTPSG